LLAENTPVYMETLYASLKPDVLEHDEKEK